MRQSKGNKDSSGEELVQAVLMAPHSFRREEVKFPATV
jgi:hypothetical protein